MKLNDYIPKFRGVLFKEQREEKTKGGIFIPEATFKVTTHADIFDNEKEHTASGKIGDYVVIKIGPDVSQTNIGEKILIMDGIRPQVIVLEDGAYFQISEQQIVGGSI